MRIEPRERLTVALDLPSVEAARTMVARLGDAVLFYKIGYEPNSARAIQRCDVK